VGNTPSTLLGIEQEFADAFFNMEVEELEVLHDFWDSHHPGTPFVFEEMLRGVSKVVYSDNDLSHEANSDCSINVSFRWIEA
jgi:hypothetical protein